MFYTPKHCNECGEKIDQGERKITSSSHFCENCEGEHKMTDWLPRLFFALSLMLALIGIGSGLRKTEQPLKIASTTVSQPSEKRVLPNTNIQTAVRENSPNQISANNAVEISKQSQISDTSAKSSQARANSDEVGKQKQSSETVYYCGAQTKKGTPCSRRVKTKGQRCWQHPGQPAM